MRNITWNFAVFFSVAACATSTLLAQQAEQTTPPPIRVKPVPAPAAAAPATPANAAAVPQGPSPKIVFETPVFDFGRARAGDPVKHTFVFTNTGEATLEITSVRPGCGCTTAGEWTKKVEPGKTGTIPIQVNVAATWPSGPIMKNVTVESNDKTQPSIQLQVKGTVWKPIEVNPQYAILNIPADAPRASTVIRITSNLEEPVKLQTPECSNKCFDLALRETKPGKEFELTVTAKTPLTNGQAQISVKTSSTNAPDIAITAWANVQPAITVMPPSITVPPAPLTAASTQVLNIQNNGTNVIKLSDAELSGMPGLEGVAVKVQESTPGKLFAVTLNFPAGFTIPAGQHVELSVKSTHPAHPVIKVPVYQTQIAGVPRPITPVKPSFTPLKPPTKPATTTSQIPVPPSAAHTAAQ